MEISSSIPIDAEDLNGIDAGSAPSGNPGGDGCAYREDHDRGADRQGIQPFYAEEKGSDGVRGGPSATDARNDAPEDRAGCLPQDETANSGTGRAEGHANPNLAAA